MEIIPEINSPGHAHAAITAMEARFRNLAPNEPSASMYRLKDPDDLSKYLSVQNFRNNVMNPCQGSTYVFIEKIVTTLQAAHQEVGVPLKTYHFGGDDVPSDAWYNSSVCNHGNRDKDWKGYFDQRIIDKTERLGINLAGYDDGFVSTENIPYPLTPSMNKDKIAQFYNSVPEWGKIHRAYDLANAGYKVSDAFNRRILLHSVTQC